MTTSTDYPAAGSTIPVGQIDAFLETLDVWRADRGTRLVELDERVQLNGSPEDREAIAFAFVLWKAIGLRLDQLHAARDRGRPDDCRSVADEVWTPVTDETGVALTADLREAVNGVEDIWSRVEQLLSLNEAARQELLTQRAAIEADLTTAERLATGLGDQIRQVAEFRERFTALAAPVRTGPAVEPVEGDDHRGELAALASAVHSTTEALVAADDVRRRMIESLGHAATDLERLRGLEAEARATAQRCREKIAAPPNLAVPSVDALESAPTGVEDRPWPGVRPQVERFLERVSKLDRALREAVTRYGAPLQRRDELRGLVQAYRDKADHKGIAERPDVDAAYQSARRELWSAPCRLDEAERLVAEYQGIVNGSPSAVDGGTEEVTMSACAQPGCSGTIEDGYCNTCGMAGSSTPPTSAAGTAEPSFEAASGSPTQPPRSERTTGLGSTTGPSGGVIEAPSVSSRLASTPIGSARTTGGSKRTRRLRGRGPARSRLGAGLTTVPVAPLIDPMLALMSPAVVAENKRHCSHCGGPVGRGRDGQPGRTKGFCPQCRTPYDFEPKLAPGVLLGGQYEVMGCLAHGGMGWIYLARDRNVNDRWVVLKGLLNAGDPDAYQAAVGEKGFLAEVEHPLIVEIYNFETDADGSSYIVMEYVGGKSLNTILKDRAASTGGRFDPLPVDQAISFMLEVLPAFSYLHAAGLLFCDFKPANLIQVGDTMKLIDLGGVRRVGDDVSPIYGTVGFQAPEVPTEGTTVASDIYTIVRTLAVLIFEFRGFQTQFEHSLPDQASVPVLAAHDSLYRLLLKGSATEPADRFQSADELRDQLLGVLREVTVDPTIGALGSTPSSLFESPVVATDKVEWSELPRLRPDPDDPMTPWIAGVTVTEPTERSAALAEAPQTTAMVHIANAYAVLAGGGSPDLAMGEADAILAEDPWDWRAVWLNGLVALATGDHAGAIRSFNTVYGQIPGELAPKLALAVACEEAGDVDVARSLYATCAGSDAAYTAPARFGLARLAESEGDLDGALDALAGIAPTSRAWTAAKGHRARLLATQASRSGDLVTLDAAAREYAQSGNDPYDLAIGRVWVLETALATVASSGDQPGAQVAGVSATDVDLRRALESTWRAAAQHSEDPADRVHCVDRANAVRPRTLM